MATLVKTYTFSPNTSAVASQVNSDVDTIINFINTSVVQTDGSQAMTGILVLPAFDPSSANQATRKSYVDAAAAAAASSAASSAVTAAMASGNSLVRFGGTSTPLVGGLPTAGANAVQYGGHNSGATDGNGDIQINFGPFPNGLLAVSANIILVTGADLARCAHPWTFATSGMKVRVANTTSGTSVTGTTVDIVWTALGW